MQVSFGHEVAAALALLSSEERRTVVRRAIHAAAKKIADAEFERRLRGEATERPIGLRLSGKE